MAGTIIADYIRTDANKLSLNVGNTTIASVNALGILSNTGAVIIGPNGALGAGATIANSSIVGTITSGQITDSAVTRTKMGFAGAVLQVVGAENGLVTVNTSTPTDIVTLNITTTKANSYLYVAASGDCNADTTGAWKRIGVYVDGVQKTIHLSSVADAAFQDMFGVASFTGPYAAGSHTVAIKAWHGSGTSTFAEEGTNKTQLVVMEIQG